MTSHHHHEVSYRCSSLGHNPILTDTTAEATMTPTEAIPGHTRGTADTITGVLPDSHTQLPIHIALTMTPHIRDHPHTEALQLTIETTADHNLVQHISQPKRPPTKIHHNPGNPTVLHTLKETPESQHMIHKWTFTVLMTTQVIQKKTQ